MVAMLLCYVLRKQLQNNIANWAEIYFLAPFQASNVCDFGDAQAPLLHIRHVFISNRRKFVIGALGGYSVAHNSVQIPLKVSQVTQKLRWNIRSAVMPKSSLFPLYAGK